jgi:hypothetical protein
MACTLGNCAALVFGLTVTGRVLDRIGPFPTMALADLARATAFTGFLLSTNLVEIGVFGFVSSSGLHLWL